MLPLSQNEVDKLHNSKYTEKLTRKRKEREYQNEILRVHELGTNKRGYTLDEYNKLMACFLGMGNKYGLYENKVDQLNNEKELKKGKVALYNTKSDMKKGKGTTYSTFSNLMRHVHESSHILGNTYCYLSNKNGSVSGGTQRNVKQINYIIIDSDYGYDYEQQDKLDKDINDLIELAKLDKLPLHLNLLLRSPKGMQMFFIFDEPVFENSKHQAVSMVKSVRNNLVKWFKENTKIVPDISANTIGICRTPHLASMEYMNLDKQDTITDCLSWVKEYTKLDKPVRKPKVKINYKGMPKLVTFMVKNAYKVKEGRRDTVIFTSGLVCKDNGVPKEIAIATLKGMNSNMSEPLPSNQVNSTIFSALNSPFHMDRPHKNILMSYLTSSERKAVVSVNWTHWAKPESEKVNHSKDYQYVQMTNFLKDRLDYTKQGNLACYSIGNVKFTKAISISKSTILGFKEECPNLGIKIIPAMHNKPTKYLFVVELVEALRNLKSNFTQLISALLSVVKINEVINTFGIKGMIVIIEFVKIGMDREYIRLTE